MFLFVSACGGSAKQVNAMAEAAVDASAAIDAAAAFDGNVDAAACWIIASNYDQSCAADSDCVTDVGTFPHEFAVSSSNYCESLCPCPGETISRAAATQYLNDVLRTPLGSGAIPFPSCSCPELGNACCMGGRCIVSLQCELNPSDGGNDDGPQGTPLESGVLCSAISGPLDSGVAQPGIAQWCPGTCAQVSSEWACCISAGPDTYLCSAP